jgi:hypothetical protein
MSSAALCAHTRRPAGTCRIYSSAHDARAATCAFAFVPSAGSRALAAGVTWTCRTSSAPWGARYWHTSVIDAAGAIYVIGGYGTGIGYVQDVWVSTDGGADRARSRGWSGGYSTVVLRVTTGGTMGILRGTSGVVGVLIGTTRANTGYYRGFYGVLWGYYMGSWGTRGVLEGYSMGYSRGT